MTDSVLTRDGPVGVPLDYQVPNSGELLPVSVRATMDGTSAASTFYATVQIISPSGRVMTNAISNPIAAGGSADVTWFRGVTNIPSSSAVLPGTSVDRSITSQSIPNNTSTPISFDSVLFDDLGWFTASSPTKITVNIAGQFLLTYTLAWVYPGAGGFAIQTGIDQLSPTAVPVSGQIAASGGQPNAQTGAAIVNVGAGTSFTLFAYQVSGGSMNTWIAGSAGTDVQPIPTLSVVRIGDRV